MPRLYESPSSINTFKQCPRKYFYCYIKKIPTKTNIHLIRGNIAHETLEKFYDIEPSVLSGLTAHDFEIVLRERAQKLLHLHWKVAMSDFRKLEMSHDEHIFYYRETKGMIQNFVTLFLSRLKTRIAQGARIDEAFAALTPIREKKLSSLKHHVMGYIDAIEDFDGKIRLMDYKTSKNSIISDSYRLQLAIYALLYREEFGQIPDKVGIYFLKGGEELIDADLELINSAAIECSSIQEQTVSDDIEDYSRKTGPLCKYSTGECDFYGLCFPNGK